MDALPLPSRPRLEEYERHARELVGLASGDVAPTSWRSDWLSGLRHLRGQDTAFAEASFERALSTLAARAEAEAGQRGSLTLPRAELMIAEAHGFASWDDFAALLGELGGDQDQFEAAADAVVGGDLVTLQTLLRENRALVWARSARVHGATLLHYVAANGVEDFRQQTSANAVEVTRALLEAGAEVDALADTYDGGNAQTTLNLLVSSAHPAAAGLQPALTEVLLDFGAAINGIDDDCSPLMTALAFGHVEAAETLVGRGARVDNVAAAAALGDIAKLKALVEEKNRPSSASTSREDPLEPALVWACRYGRGEAATFLLRAGVDPAVSDENGMTALHWAAWNGHVELVERLVGEGAPLEATNRYGGTVLSSTVFSVSQNPGRAATVLPVVERLLAAGADVSRVGYPSGSEAIDSLLHGYFKSP